MYECSGIRFVHHSLQFTKWKWWIFFQLYQVNILTKIIADPVLWQVYTDNNIHWVPFWGGTFIYDVGVVSREQYLYLYHGYKIMTNQIAPLLIYQPTTKRIQCSNKLIVWCYYWSFYHHIIYIHGKRKALILKWMAGLYRVDIGKGGTWTAIIKWKFIIILD